MESRFLDKTLEKYKWQPGQFSGKKECFAVTSKANFRKENYSSELTLIPEDAEPSTDILKKSKLIYLDQASGDFLKYVKDMSNLEALRILSNHVPTLNESTLPASLKFLSILHNDDNSKLQKVSFSDKNYPHLTALAIINSVLIKPNKRIEARLEFDENNFPNLEYLRCMLDTKLNAVQLVKNFRGLLHLCIGGVEKINLFDFIGDNLLSLQIEGAGKDFEITEMARKPTIEMIRFNSIYNTIDCESFLLMPKLKEIFILNCKSLINVEALLEMKSLESLEILNCKGAMGKPLKDKFKESASFKYLRVDYA